MNGATQNYGNTLQLKYNLADSALYVFQTEKALNEVGDKVPESDKTQVQADLESFLPDQSRDSADFSGY